MREVELWWIGTGPLDGPLLEAVRRHVEAVFDVAAEVRRPALRPPDSFEPRRAQHASGRILSWLAEARPAGPERVLGVTDVDLFMPVLTFVFGEAQLGGRAAIVSTARLLPHAGPPGDVLLTRLAKEAVHELGHTFGLLHCEQRLCVMHRSAGLADVDAKSPWLCRSCRRRRSAFADEETSHDEPPPHAHLDRG